MVAYACIPAPGDAHLARITTRCRALKLGKPHILEMSAEDGVLPVTVAALKILRRGGSVSIVADLKHVHVPTSLLKSQANTEGITDVEWRESWLTFLESHVIPFYHTDPSAEVDAATIERTSAIRSYRNGIAALEAAVAAHQRPARAPLSYVCGRPPFGYRVVDKHLKIDRSQAVAVRLIFKAIRSGKNIQQAVDVVAAREAAHPTGEFWDRKKVARILAHAPLYCAGSYAVRGTTVTLPHLVFLPADWIGTAKRTPVPSAGAPDTMAGRS